MLGDYDTPSRIIRFRKNDPTSDVDNIIVEDDKRNTFDTIGETLGLEQGTILAGHLRENPGVTHPLRVVRVNDSEIYVSRLDDSTEKVFRIPLEEGISPSSEYAFLRPAILEDDGESKTDDRIKTEIEQAKENFIATLKNTAGVKVIYTEMPTIIEREESIRPGGSRDVERIAGQVVSAISALDTRGTLDHGADGSRIRDILLKNTLGMGSDGRTPIKGDEPILIRGKTSYKLPEWVLPISIKQKKDDDTGAFSLNTEDFIKNVPDMARDNRSQPYSFYYKTATSALRIPPDQTDKRGEGDVLPITSPTLVVFTEQPTIELDELTLRNKKMVGKFPPTEMDMRRILTPEDRTLTGGVLKEGDKISVKTGLTIPNQGYVPPDAPLELRLRSELPWRVRSGSNISVGDAMISSTYNPVVLSKKALLLPNGIIKSAKDTLSFLSPTLTTLIKALPPIRIGSLRTIGNIGASYGWYDTNKMSDIERVLVSIYLEKVNGLIKNYVNSLPKEPGFTFPIPDAIFKGNEGLRSMYPNTIGIIGEREAFDRIMSTYGDYGRLLLYVLGTNEHRDIQRVIEAVIKESEGRRIEIRNQMAIVQEQLRELDSRLKSLPAIAKHYGSRKEIEQANLLAREQKIRPLWDPSLDNDVHAVLYNGERLNKVIGSVLAELQERGELDLRPSVTRAPGDEMDEIVCDEDETIASRIPPEILVNAVREDLIKYNATLPTKSQIPDEKFEIIVKRIIQGGRPVETGDIALITRHLRTAAYRWNDDMHRWVPVKETDEMFQSDDIDPAKTKAAKVFTKTLALNKEYRVLSKTRDDLELLSTRPDMMMSPEMYKGVIDDMLEKITELSDKRTAIIGANRILDEYPFVHDVIPNLVPRFVVATEMIGKREEDMGVEGLPAATREDFRKALVTDKLVVDSELELFMAGYKGYMEQKDAIKEIGMDSATAGLRASSIGDIPIGVDDPAMADIMGRRGGVSYITEASGENKKRRIYLGAIGFMETLFGIQLTQDEIVGCYTDYASVIPSGLSSAGAIILKGIAMYCLMIMTRVGTEIHLPKSEGVTPPASNQYLPSYAGMPLLGENDIKKAKFIEYVINVLQKTTEKSLKDTKATTVYIVVLTNLKKTELLGKIRDGKDKEERRNEKDPVMILAETIKKCYSISPTGIIRVLQTDESYGIYKKTKMAGRVEIKGGESAIVLRTIGEWEKLPITHMPHPNSLLMKKATEVLREQKILFRDAYGVPYPQNASLGSYIKTPELPNNLENMKHAGAERLSEIMYKRDPLYKSFSKRRRGVGGVEEGIERDETTVLLTPTPKFISVRRERVEGGRLMGAEVPAMETLEALAPSKLPSPGGEEAKGEKLNEEKIRELFKDILAENEVELLERDDIEGVERFLRVIKVIEDFNGTTRGNLIAFHDAMMMALEQIRRRYKGEREPTPIEANIIGSKEYSGYKFNIDSVPIYTARRLVKRVLKGIEPMKIEYSKEDYPEKGGTTNTILTGKNSYFENVKILNRLLREYGLRTLETTETMIKLIREIGELLQNYPPRVSVERATGEIAGIMKKYYMNVGEKTEFLSVNIYVAILSHRMRNGDSIVEIIRNTSGEYTDVNEEIIDEELNHDRERERQRFIYQLEGLDPERRKLVRSVRALGLDLAGKVAQDPRKFNSEYYELQLEMITEQQIEERYDPTKTMGVEVRTGVYGDGEDIMNERDAEGGAAIEMEKIEDLDYDG
jgi:hypothetical protein